MTDTPGSITADMGQARADPLTAKQREAFEREGYLVIDPEIPAEVLDGILADLEPRYLYEGNEPVLKDGVLYSPGRSPRIRDAWRISENVKATALAPKILALLESLYGRKPRPFQTLNFPVGTQQAPHSDAMHFRPDDPNLMCGVWVPLENIDMDNGPLIYFPGSHKLPFTAASDVGFDTNLSDHATVHEYSIARNRQYEAHVRELIKEHDLSPEYATTKKGEALVWSANLLHGGAPRTDKDRTRHSQVTHYLFEGYSRYRTEMRTEGDEVFWTSPTFIT